MTFKKKKKKKEKKKKQTNKPQNQEPTIHDLSNTFSIHFLRLLGLGGVLDDETLAALEVEVDEDLPLAFFTALTCLFYRKE